VDHPHGELNATDVRMFKLPVSRVFGQADQAGDVAVEQGGQHGMAVLAG
jgi:hypothetical protein